MLSSTETLAKSWWRIWKRRHIPPEHCNLLIEVCRDILCLELEIYKLPICAITAMRAIERMYVLFPKKILAHLLLRC